MSLRRASTRGSYSLIEGVTGSHPSALRAGPGHDGEAWSSEVEPWVLELEVGKAKERFGVKRRPLIPL